MKPWFWIVVAIPLVLTYALTWIPQINGPQLWLGMPSLFVWLSVVSSLVVPACLWLIERKRTDLDEAGEETSL